MKVNNILFVILLCIQNLMNAAKTRLLENEIELNQYYENLDSKRFFEIDSNLSYCMPKVLTNLIDQYLFTSKDDCSQTW